MPTSFEPSHVIQMLVSLQKEVSTLSAKTHRLISDVEKIDTKVGGLNTTLNWAKGFGAAAALLVPICAVLIWWLIGGKLNDMRDQLVSAKPPVAAAQPANQLPGAK